MGYYDQYSQKISIYPCSDECICNELIGHENECELQFAGFSKCHNKGIHFKNKFYTERLAESWDGNVHDYHITIRREEVVKKGDLLKKLTQIRHSNLMSVISFCNCTISMEYLPGLLLNSKKEAWLIGTRVGEKDYADNCNYDEMLNVFIQVGDALQFLHNNGICHTDPIDHNIIVLADGTAKLIDLIGVMEKQEEFLKLDKYVFLNCLILPMLKRMNRCLTKEMNKKVLCKGDYDLSELLYDIKKLKS